MPSTTTVSRISLMSSQEILSPFLKWAGGKRWLVRHHLSSFDLSETRRYVEPFLGSGAVFFSLQAPAALLNDMNPKLVETYRAIAEQWQDVVVILGNHQRKHSPEYYYRTRDVVHRGVAARAAQLIYLNRTCFNGLYRVNRSGKFNVPIGTKSSVLLDTDNFEAVAAKLADAELMCGDFEGVIARCGAGDFIFADPPYTVKHNNNGFVKYNERLFSWQDQERLKECLEDAALRGARVLVSNADHPSIRDLYYGCHVETLSRHSVMASESARRKRTSEVLIRI